MPKAKLLRIAIVEDHEMTRGALSDALSDWEHGTVVLEAANGLEYEQACAGKPAPDVAIVDLSMPVRDGYDTIKWIRQTQPDTIPLAWSHDPGDAESRKAMVCGACAIIPKSYSRRDWLAALEDVRLTGRHANSITDRLLTQPLLSVAEENLRRKAIEELSDRQLEFLLHYIGMDEPTLPEVAKRMKVQLSTVESFRKRVVEKCGVSSRTELRLFAQRFGLLK